MTGHRPSAAAAAAPRAAIYAAAGVALVCIGNAGAMLAAPGRWFVTVPGVLATGGYNAHFIRDIGLAYLVAGGALAAGCLLPVHRVLLWAGAAAWLGLHALLHLSEVAAGICGPASLLRDFSGVTLPALVAGGCALAAARS